jgi:tetratricopeptide (TPR) repeat protein
MRSCSEMRTDFARARLVPVIVLILATVFSTGSRAEKKSYRYEDDPIRLGMKALETDSLNAARRYFEEAIQNEHLVYQAHYGQALILYREGRYADAEPLFRQSVIEKNKETGASDYAEAHAGLGLVLLRLGRTAEAEQEFNQALKEKSGVWEAQYGMARILIMKKEYGEAEKYLEKGSRKKGLVEGADLYQYGEALMKFEQGDMAGAEKNALAAFYINANDPDYGTLVADIYTKRGARSLAIEAYERALGTPGLLVSAPIHERLGALYEEEKRYNDALRQYQDAVKTDSTYAPAIKKMAALYALANRNEEAAIAYMNFVKLRTSDPEGFQGLAEACLKTKRFRQAYESAQQAFGLDSSNVAIRLTLARASFQNKEKARSAALYAGIPDTVRLEAADYVKKGQLKLEAKNFDGTRADLTKALDMDSLLTDAHFAMGLMYLQSGKPDSAVTFLTRATELAPGSSGAWLNRGIAYLQKKDNPMAIRSLREAVRLSPDYGPGWVYLGGALVSADSMDAAQASYRAALKADPKSTSAMRGLGYCYLKMKRFDSAASTFKDATDIEPNNPDGWYMLGQAYGSAGNLAGGIAAEEKALEINPQHEGAKKVLEILKKASKPAGGN